MLEISLLFFNSKGKYKGGGGGKRRKETWAANGGQNLSFELLSDIGQGSNIFPRNIWNSSKPGKKKNEYQLPFFFFSFSFQTPLFLQKVALFSKLVESPAFR